MQSYKDLIVWQKAITLVKEVYKISENFPKTEQYGLTNQLRRASVSIPANIAEGYARKHRAEYIQFLRIAFGSGAEVETYFELIVELNYAKKAELEKAALLLDEVMRMLNSLLSSLVAKP
jgi:four helix bundle protein